MAKEDRANPARINGAKSTGPKSASGRAKCAESAKKRHSATTGILPGEDAEAFEAARIALHLYLQPFGPIEAHMVDEIAHINHEISRKLLSQNTDLCHAYDEVLKRATYPITKAEAVAGAEIDRAVPGGAQLVLDRGLQTLTTMRSRLLRDLSRLRKEQKTTLKVQPALETNDLRSDPPDPQSVLPPPTGPALACSALVQPDLSRESAQVHAVTGTSPSCLSTRGDETQLLQLPSLFPLANRYRGPPRSERQIS